jgi:hypothetical protein
VTLDSDDKYYFEFFPTYPPKHVKLGFGYSKINGNVTAISSYIKKDEFFYYEID